MYSLEQLNNYSNLDAIYRDDRPVAVTTTPANLTSLSSTVYGDEGQTHVLPVPFTLNTAQSINITYTINLSAYANSTVTWDSLPGIVTYTELATGVFQLANIRSVGEWQQVQSPDVFMGADQSGNLAYTANVKWDANSTPVSWNIYAILQDASEINTSNLPAFTYDQDLNAVFDSGLEITDTENPTGSYRVEVTKDINSAGALNSSGNVSASTSYSNNKLTIEGQKIAVNDHLTNMEFIPSSGYVGNVVLTYKVTNLTSNVVSFATQSGSVGELEIAIKNMSFNRTYNINQDTYIFQNNTPYISDTTTNYFSPDANTKLLLRGDNLFDSSAANNAPTSTSAITINTTDPRFGNACLSFGSNANVAASITYSNVSTLNNSTGSWTYEMMVKPQAEQLTASSQWLFELGPYDVKAMISSGNNVTLYIDTGDGGSYERTENLGLFASDKWTHLAVTYNSINSTWYIHKDGSFYTSFILPLATASGSNLLKIGNNYKGLVDEVRYSNIARYSTEELPDLAEPVYTIAFDMEFPLNVVDKYPAFTTSLLVNGTASFANDFYNVIDESKQTNILNKATTSDIVPYGTGRSIYFDNSTSEKKSLTYSTNGFAGNFTVEFMVRFNPTFTLEDNNLAGTTQLASLGYNSAGQQNWIQVTTRKTTGTYNGVPPPPVAANQFRIGFWNGQTLVDIQGINVNSYDIPGNTWVKVMWSQRGTEWALWVNGAARGYGSWSPILAGNGSIELGGSGGAGSGLPAGNRNTVSFWLMDFKYQPGIFRKISPSYPVGERYTPITGPMTEGNYVDATTNLKLRTLATPNNWNTVDRRYTFSGYRDQCNTVFQNLQFLAQSGYNRTIPVSYTQRKNGVYQTGQNFTLTAI